MSDWIVYACGCEDYPMGDVSGEKWLDIDTISTTCERCDKGIAAINISSLLRIKEAAEAANREYSYFGLKADDALSLVRIALQNEAASE